MIMYKYIHNVKQILGKIKNDNNFGDNDFNKFNWFSVGALCFYL